METAKLYYRVDRRRINLVKFIFEAYEGLAVVTTLNAGDGTLVLSVSPECVETARRVMSDLARQMLIAAVPAFNPGTVVTALSQGT